MTIRLSPYTDSDLSSVVSVWNESLPLDATTPEAFTARILLDENFDPETFLLAKDGNDLAGFALGFHAKRLPMGDADPQGTRGWCLGIGVAAHRTFSDVARVLLGGLEERLKSLGKSECFFSTYPAAYFTPGIDRGNYRHILEFLLSQGYTEEKQALSMDAPIALFEVSPKIAEIQKGLAAKGIDFRTFRADDTIRFLGFLDRTMPTDWLRVERRNLRLIPTGQFRPDQITVVTLGDEIIGYCQFEGSHFGPFGVAELHQGKGIGTVLLARTLERMRHQGLHNAWVMWTDDLAAKVYQKFGFSETRRFSILRKSLSS